MCGKGGDRVVEAERVVVWNKECLWGFPVEDVMTHELPFFFHYVGWVADDEVVSFVL